MFFINGTPIGNGSPTYIIAELSANHNQNLNTARQLIREAYKAGANAIKLQTYTPDTITLKCDNKYFQIKEGPWKGQTLHQLYSKAYTPWDWHFELKRCANNFGMDLFTSPFDVTAVDFLESINMPAYKVASCEITDHILLRRIGKTKKPVIISSGMATEDELSTAITILRTYGTSHICMLKCTSAYPAQPKDANLATILDMNRKFQIDCVGISDHTLGNVVPITSVVLGAKVIEKHFTLSRNSGSPDDAFSLTPVEFKEMVDAVRATEKSIGEIKYGGVKSEAHTRKFRRSLFVVENMKKGDVFTEQNIKSIRPGDGLHTQYYCSILGKICVADVERGTPLDWSIIDNNVICDWKSTGINYSMLM